MEHRPCPYRRMPGAPSCIEVYPHPAMVGLFFPALHDPLQGQEGGATSPASRRHTRCSCPSWSDTCPNWTCLLNQRAGEQLRAVAARPAAQGGTRAHRGRDRRHRLRTSALAVEPTVATRLASTSAFAPDTSSPRLPPPVAPAHAAPGEQRASAGTGGYAAVLTDPAAGATSRRDELEDPRASTWSESGARGSTPGEARLLADPGAAALRALTAAVTPLTLNTCSSCHTRWSSAGSLPCRGVAEARGRGGRRPACWPRCGR